MMLLVTGKHLSVNVEMVVTPSVNCKLDTDGAFVSTTYFAVVSEGDSIEISQNLTSLIIPRCTIVNRSKGLSILTNSQEYS